MPARDSEILRKLARQAFERCDRAAAFTDVPGMIHRTFCSPAMANLHQTLSEWMATAGMTCRVDAAGNLLGRFNPTSDPDAPALLIGSHLDTVPNAGRYDGPLGVMLGLALVELVAAMELKLPFAIEVVGFSEEEGVRFGTPFIGSRALIGDCDAALLSRVDAGDNSVESALQQFGCVPQAIATAEIDASRVVAFVEAHIEQGPVLQSHGLSLGVVSAIAGQTRAAARFTGAAGHAGTVPMHLRRDALAAAAECITAVERLARHTSGLVATIGVAEVVPGVGNVIPGEARLRLDVRHADDDQRNAAVAELRDIGENLAARRGVEFEFSVSHEHSAVALDEPMTHLLEQAISDADAQPMRLVSGAGHDAAVMARRFPAAMLFIRCRDGISHHPEESVEEADAVAALTALWHFVRRLAEANA